MAKQTFQRAGDNRTLESIIPTPSHKRVFMSYWTSPESLAAHVESMGEDGANNWHKGAWTNGASFTGSENMKDAIAICRAGWPDGAERANRLRDRINAANPTGPRLVRWDIAGAVPSVPRMLSGNPMHMRRLDVTRSRRRPVITLLSDMADNGNVSAIAITNRAAVVAAIIDAIEAAGFGCDVVTYESSMREGLSQVVAATVKESGVHADIGRLAFALGHASFFRRLAWAAFTCDAFTEKLGVGLGTANRLDQSAANERGAYILPSAGGNESAFRTEDSAATNGLAFLIAALQEQGCPAFPRNEEAAA